MQLPWRYSKNSYAQCGEDLIVDFLLSNVLKIGKPSYLDVGAHHPVHLNNTYYFYRRGSSGVCIEPNPTLYNAIKRQRKRDVCLNCGIAIEAKAAADFFVMSAPALSTFSQADAKALQATNKHTILEVLRVPLVPISDVLKQHFPKPPDFLSIDTEGPDLEILQQMDAIGCHPSVVCVETLTYSEHNTERKKHEITEFMCGHGYQVYADTWINTVFVSTAAWAQRS